MKYKYVLEYRNLNLVNQGTPTDEEIARQVDHIHDVEETFERLKQQKEGMQQLIREIRNRVKGQDREIASLRRSFREQELLNSRVKHDLQLGLENCQSRKLLKPSLRALGE
eukprot:EC689485.1.p1 GENE.EC689485.1~~EC689485.1.p1  ORF type:complete len:111 (+),score=26.35 EC689485.1:139-471(+)